jgi:hypothetical protein
MMLIDQAGPDFTKPPVKMVGEDGNVFAIIGRVRRALRRAGRSDLAQEFTARATASSSYDAVLALVFEYCDVDPDDGSTSDE